VRERVQQRLAAHEQRPGLVDLADHDTGPERRGALVQGDPAEHRGQQR
jgi:hypothetical protein